MTTFSTVLRFDTARDVTLAEMRIELVHPADEHSERVLRALAEGSATSDSIADSA